jgi:hypothetical protein
MLHFRLAEIAGSLDVDAVADSLTNDQIMEWWAYGCLNGWFINPDHLEQGGMDAEDSLEFFKGLGSGRNNHT